MLSLCATPIGNLEDITLRVLTALRTADVIFCEDTRHSSLLLNHFEIKKPLVSCHEHNERMRAEELCTLISEGKNVCYISDAGMPCISDPGAVLMQACIERGLPFEILPGASAALMSAVYAGLGSEHFLFYGFLPRMGKERTEAIKGFATQTCPVIVYESPHRVRATLEDLYASLGEMDAAVLRELTKKFECAERGKLTDLIARFETEPKGECVIVFHPGTREKPVAAAEDLDTAIRSALSDGLSVKDAAAEVAVRLDLKKKQVYARALVLKEEWGE